MKKQLIFHTFKWSIYANCTTVRSKLFRSCKNKHRKFQTTNQSIPIPKLTPNHSKCKRKHVNSLSRLIRCRRRSMRGKLMLRRLLGNTKLCSCRRKLRLLKVSTISWMLRQLMFAEVRFRVLGFKIAWRQVQLTQVITKLPRK